jgi:hydrogenase maturation protease
MDGFEQLRAPRPRSVRVAGHELGRGSRVVLRPRGAGADALDRALAGKLGVIDAVLCDMEGGIQLGVVLEDDPGRDLGELRQPGHRFFFAPDEVEPLADQPATTRVLVAGIGNVFMADDGFGVEVAKRLAERRLPPGVEVRDFGIRGLDLVYALGEGYDAVVLVDLVARGSAPGTLFVIEPDLDEQVEQVALDAHGMDPVKVLALARQLGDVPERVLLVGCEPQVRMRGDEQDLVGELSPPVGAAVGEAVGLVEALLLELTMPERRTETP